MGPYEVVDLLGAGGMGEVYRARDTRLRREVALKVLQPEIAGDADHVARFRREAAAAAALSHPNICTIYEIGDAQGRTFIAMEYVAGQTLQARLAGPPLTITEVLDIAIQLADGLNEARQRHVVHRDLKSANVVLTARGQVKILDFGLAKQLHADGEGTLTTEELTRAGILMGTLAYMAPEQARGGEVDHRSDLFSFGVVLYELLTGRRPFDGASTADVLHAMIYDSPAPIPRYNNDVPDTLVRLVSKLLEKDPERRYQSAHDVWIDLRRIREEQSGTAAAQPVSVAASHRTLPLRAAILAGVLVLVAVAAWAVMARRWHAAGRSAIAERDHVLAVLPFESIAADQSNEYFAAGMTDEIVAQLSKLASLRVISSNAVARYTRAKADRPRDWDDLGVGRLVTGSVRQAGPKVRIHVQLVDARSDQTLWSEEYDGALQDIFAVQSDVARRIAGALQLTLNPAEGQRIDRPPTRNLEAYNLYLRATRLAGPGDRSSTPSAELNDTAIDLLQQAVRLDPDFALAHAVLARRFGFKSDFGDKKYLSLALDEARKAVAADPTSGRAYHALGVTQYRIGRVREGELALLRATELDPSFGDALADLSNAEVGIGHLDQGLYWARRGFTVAPNMAGSYYHVGVALLELAGDEATQRWLADSRLRLPRYARIPILLATLEVLNGRDHTALDLLRHTMQEDPANDELQVAFMDMAVIAAAPERESLAEARFRTGPEARGNLLPESSRLLYAYVLRERGETARANLLIAQAFDVAQRELRDGNDFPEVPMELAAIAALRGDADEAVRWLTQGYKAGWRYYRELARDPLLQTMRTDPRFIALLEQMKNDVTAMRHRIDVDANPPMPPAAALIGGDGRQARR